MQLGCGVYVTQNLGIDEHDFTSLVVYPNPTTNQINISAPVAIERISIYNLLGQQLQTHAPSAKEYKVELSALPPGTYFLKAISGNLTLTRKILKQ